MNFFKVIKSYQKIKQRSKFKANLAVFVMTSLSYIISLGWVTKRPKQTKCDVLVWHVTESVVWRTQPLVKLLQERGYVVATGATFPIPKTLFKRMLSLPKSKVPRSLLFYASHARYVVEKFKPKLLVTLIDTSLYSPFLQMEMKAYGKVVNISHAVTVPDYRTAGMTSFDYYFLFGRKALENLLSNKFRVGTTKAVLTGSIFIGKEFELPPIKFNRKILFFSTWVHHHRKKIILDSFDIVASWARKNPDYLLYVKLHPVEDSDYWERISNELGNVVIVESNVSIKECLRNVCMVMVTLSAASVEAALLNRPIVIVNDSDMDDSLLGVESFFPKRARSDEELRLRIQEILKNKTYYDKQCELYANYHLAKKQDSLEFVSKLLEEIMTGKDVAYEMVVPENYCLDDAERVFSESQIQ